ncbi:MAG: hypothetical protein OXI59_03605 [Gemmatimonadota bacterium]|nr:hypothetical protein [Gemmatimonadota bacterium]
MFRTTIIALILTVGATVAYSHDHMCDLRWPFTEQVITADNVWLICGTGANPGRITEVRWHKTRPMLVELGRTGEGEINPLAPAFSVWDIANNVATFSAIDLTFRQLELASDLLVLGTDAGSLKVWDLFQENFLYELYVHHGEVSELLLHPSEDWLLVVIDQAKLFRVDLESQSVTEIQLRNSKDMVLGALAFSSDGRMLAAAGNGMIGVWDTHDWRPWEPAALTFESAAALLFANEDSHLILLADRSVSRWSHSDKRVSFVRRLMPYARSRNCTLLGGDMSPDGSLLMTTTVCGDLRAWDLRKDKELYVHQLHNLVLNSDGVPTSFSPDGRFLIDRSGNNGFTVLVVPEYE